MKYCLQIYHVCARAFNKLQKNSNKMMTRMIRISLI